MSAPPFARWHVWAGNDPGTVLRLRDGSGALDLTGAVVVLTITRAEGDVLVLRSGVDAAVSIPDQSVIENRGQIEVRLSLAQGRALPLSSPMPFEIEVWRAGVQRTWVAYPRARSPALELLPTMRIQWSLCALLPGIWRSASEALL